MTSRPEDRKAELLERLAARLRDKLAAKEAALAETFLRHYYRGVAAQDLLERDLLDLYGTALAHLRFGQEREPGEAKVRVYNPQLEQHGWQSTHTIVEIVTDDMPFLVDSATMELTRHNLVSHLVIHPVLAVRRSRGGRLVEVAAATEAGEGFRLESFMHCEIDRQSDPAVLVDLERHLLRVLRDVRAACADWQAMMARIDEAVAELEPARRHLDPADFEELGAFLAWIRDHHFTFLGYARYELFEDENGDQIRRRAEDSLGILSLAGAGEPRSKSFAELPRAIRRRARSPLPAVLITKANTRSTVHRPTYLDYVGVKRYDADGRVIGEHRFLGLLTSAAYNRSPKDIPLLRRKVARIVARAGLPPASHDGKALTNILETYPRDELFQTSDDDLFAITQQILQLQERQRIRLFLRSDAFARFVSCLVFVPRERYNTTLRERMQQILLDALGGTEVEFRAQLSESVLARVLFIVRTPTGRIAEVDVADLERRLVEAARSWADMLREALIDAEGEAEGNRLFAAFGGCFPLAYQDEVPARLAVADVQRLERLARGETDLAMSLYRLLEDPDGLLRFKLIRGGEPIHLSAALPVLENMGLSVLDERPYSLRGRDGRGYWIHDFGMMPTPELALDPEDIRAAFQECFDQVWHGEAENDGFNRLVLHAGLACREVVVLRAYCKYLLQVGIPFSQSYVEQTLAGNPELARLLTRLFAARFDPDAAAGRAERVAEIEGRIAEALDAVVNLDEDRILRRFLRLIQATLRTNAYQRQGTPPRPKPHLSLKLDPALVPDMPLPRPAFEIFVYGVRVEGVHLRGGKVARGGLRWSDRREDFRTEILGLMKAQMVKNAVIVPVGAKGGFVVKRPPRGGDREALLEEGVECYRTFLRGLLDITDNRVGDGVVPPERVVRYDDDDPYLVVAADKGTATFSDIANEVSRSYDFWMDDAFASGGSAGYDHKKMGITAKGGWESVKHHFRAMDRDCQSEPFTCVGIGDMSGDVFGNAMLLSGQTRLIAAFDHRHIFLDPNPDPVASFEERARLFALPRSSWDDYDRSRISEGGGVHARSLKSIELSAEVRAALDVETEHLTPSELIRAILKAPVDLLWNGGIGTYVKAAHETHAMVRDRANDALRVDAEELRCRILGEGGNLGLTQAARVAFALKGGRINTDFIDNSAGVDCSDHEVNIKILLGQVLAAGDMTMKQRDRLLAQMTDEVAALCLRDNVLQNVAVSLTEHLGDELLDAQIMMMRRLEAAGRLSRELEGLPGDEELAERRGAGGGLTRPELALLLAYGKMTLYQDLLDSDLPDDPYFTGDLVKYFPRPLRKRLRGPIAQHRLRRELVATAVANSLVNRGLDVFVSELHEATGADADEIARAYVVARDAFGLVPLWGAIEALPASVAAARQMAMLAEARRVLVRGSHWFLRNLAPPIAIEEAVARFRPGIAALIGRLEDTLSAEARGLWRAAVEDHLAAGIGNELALPLASLPYLLPACEAVKVAEAVRVEVAQAGRVYFALDASLHLDELRRSFGRIKLTNRWDRLALAGLQDDLFREQRGLAVQALERGVLAPAGDGELAAWLACDMRGLERVRRLLGEIEAVPTPDVAMLSVAVRSLGQLAPAGRSSG